MLQRLARRAIVLLLVAMMLPTAVQTVARALFASAHSSPSSAPNPAGSMLGTVVLLFFLLGLAVRIGRAWRHRDPARARERDQQRRRAALAARRPAEDVPLHQPHFTEPDDPDPQLPFEDF